MAKRLRISQPTVFTTLLSPLVDTIYIEESDTIEQWLYAGTTNQYSPNRQTTPLVLTPRIEVYDPDSKTTSNPTFSVHWYVQYWNVNKTPEAGWDEMEVTALNGNDNPDYYKDGVNLVVRKNISPTYGDTVRCVATYNDPRDLSVQNSLEESVLLTCNIDSSIETIIINIKDGSTVTYCPLTDATSIHQFSAQVLADGVDVTSQYYLEWYGRMYFDDGTFTSLQKIENFAAYTQTAQASGKGQGTDTIKVDALYAEHLEITVRAKKTAQGNLYPEQAVTAYVWKIPEVNVTTYSENGSGTSMGNRMITFKNIVNCKGRTIPENVANANLLFHWKSRISSLSVETDRGYSPTLCVSSVALAQNTSKSTPVYADVSLLGAYEETTYNNSPVTYNNETVYSRV